MPKLLEYDRHLPQLKLKSLAIVSLICGLLSGPTAVGVAVLASRNSLPDKTKDLVSTLSLDIVLAGSFVFGIVARVKLSVPSRERLLANIGIISIIAWGFVIFLYTWIVDAIGRF